MRIKSYSSIKDIKPALACRMSCKCENPFIKWRPNSTHTQARRNVRVCVRAVNTKPTHMRAGEQLDVCYLITILRAN